MVITLVSPSLCFGWRFPRAELAKETAAVQISILSLPKWLKDIHFSCSAPSLPTEFFLVVVCRSIWGIYPFPTESLQHNIFSTLLYSRKEPNIFSLFSCLRSYPVSSVAESGYRPASFGKQHPLQRAQIPTWRKYKGLLLNHRVNLSATFCQLATWSSS